MNTIVPFTVRRPEVVAALPDADWRYVGYAVTDYWALLRDLWAAAETVIIVEHDIVPGDMVAELAACSEDWCAAAYSFEDRMYHGMGCVKFSGTLMRRQPQAILRVGQMDGSPHHPPRHWCSLDAYLQFQLRARGEAMHQHGAVTHLTPGRSHGCPSPNYVRG